MVRIKTQVPAGPPAEPFCHHKVLMTHRMWYAGGCAADALDNHKAPKAPVWTGTAAAGSQPVPLPSGQRSRGAAQRAPDSCMRPLPHCSLSSVRSISARSLGPCDVSPCTISASGHTMDVGVCGLPMPLKLPWKYCRQADREGRKRGRGERRLCAGVSGRLQAGAGRQCDPLGMPIHVGNDTPACNDQNPASSDVPPHPLPAADRARMNTHKGVLCAEDALARVLVDLWVVGVAQQRDG